MNKGRRNWLDLIHTALMNAQDRATEDTLYEYREALMAEVDALEGVYAEGEEALEAIPGFESTREQCEEALEALENAIDYLNDAIENLKEMIDSQESDYTLEDIQELVSDAMDEIDNAQCV